MNTPVAIKLSTEYFLESPTSVKATMLGLNTAIASEFKLLLPKELCLRLQAIYNTNPAPKVQLSIHQASREDWEAVGRVLSVELSQTSHLEKLHCHLIFQPEDWKQIDQLLLRFKPVPAGTMDQSPRSARK